VEPGSARAGRPERSVRAHEANTSAHGWAFLEGLRTLWGGTKVSVPGRGRFARGMEHA